MPQRSKASHNPCFRYRKNRLLMVTIQCRCKIVLRCSRSGSLSRFDAEAGIIRRPFLVVPSQRTDGFPVSVSSGVEHKRRISPAGVGIGAKSTRYRPHPNLSQLILVYVCRRKCRRCFLLIPYASCSGFLLAICARNAFSNSGGSFLPRRSARRSIPAHAFADK